MKKRRILIILIAFILALTACSPDIDNSDIDTSVKQFCPYCGEKIGENASEYSICPECNAELSGDWNSQASEPTIKPTPDYIVPTYVAAKDGEQIVVKEGDIVECFSAKNCWLAFSSEDLPQNAGEDYENGDFFGLHASRFENVVVFDWANDVTFGEYHLFNADNPSIEYPCQMHFKDDGSQQGSFLPEDEESPSMLWFGETDNISLTMECNGVTIYFRNLTFDQL